MIEIINNSSVYKTNLDSRTECWITENIPGEELLFNRGLVGRDFSRICYEESSIMLRHLADQLDFKKLSEIIVLSKGFYYQLFAAARDVLDENLQINFIATKRVIDASGKCDVVVSYSDFSSLSDDLIIGDTIASGATICTVLSAYLKKHSIRNLYILSYCGSVVGGIVISHFCKEHNINLTMVYSLAAFGLAHNGFDLSFLHPDTITSKKYIERAKDYYHGKPVSAVGVDFGSQSQCIDKYMNLCSLERDYWNLGDDVFPLYKKEINRDLVQKEMVAFYK